MSVQYTHALSFTVGSGYSWQTGVQVGVDTFITTGTATFTVPMHPTTGNGVLPLVQNISPLLDVYAVALAATLPGTAEDNLLGQSVGVPHSFSVAALGGNINQAYHATFFFPVPAPDSFSPYLEVYDLSFTPMNTGSDYGAPYSFKVKVFESSSQHSIYEIINTGGGAFATTDQLWTITRTVNTWGNMIDFTLLATHHTKRVRLDIVGSEDVNAIVGKLDESWPTGCWIELVNNGSGRVINCTNALGATVNFLSGTNTIKQGEYARFVFVGGSTWDMHLYPSTTRISNLKLDDLFDVTTAGSTENYTLVKTALGDWGTAPLPTVTTPLKSAPLTTVITAAATIDVGSSLHHNNHYRCTNATGVVIQVKLDSTFSGVQEYWENNFAPSSPAPMPIGGTILVGKHGAGNVVFQPDPGVIINTPDTLTISNIHGKATLIKVAANEWDLEGNIGA